MEYLRHTILIIQSHPGLRAYLSEILQRKYECQVVDDIRGAEAFTSQEANHFDLAIVDTENDLIWETQQLMNKIKEERDLPVLYLTNDAKQMIDNTQLRVGVDDYIVKPFSAKQLLIHIHGLLKNSALRRLIRQRSSVTPQESEKQLSNSDRQWLSQVTQKLTEHLANEAYNQSRLAQDLFMGERQLRRKIRQMTGLSYNHFLRELRLKKAYELLESGTYQTVSEVSYRVGIKSQTYFSKIFKARFGKLPSAI